MKPWKATKNNEAVSNNTIRIKEREMKKGYINDSLRVHLDHGTEAMESRFFLVVVANVAKGFAPGLGEHGEVRGDLLGTNESKAANRDGCILEKGSRGGFFVPQEVKQPVQDGNDIGLDLGTYWDDIGEVNVSLLLLFSHLFFIFKGERGYEPTCRTISPMAQIALLQTDTDVGLMLWIKMGRITFRWGFRWWKQATDKSPTRAKALCLTSGISSFGREEKTEEKTGE